MLVRGSRLGFGAWGLRPRCCRVLGCFRVYGFGLRIYGSGGLSYDVLGFSALAAQLI